ncbi:hypothetical protein FOCC_FOCC004832 [Frankliniella occidentalis]|nr:hypothetical protein FOCC_FOCC004832 [Frankliniella occidentalis]
MPEQRGVSPTHIHHEGRRFRPGRCRLRLRRPHPRHHPAARAPARQRRHPERASGRQLRLLLRGGPRLPGREPRGAARADPRGRQLPRHPRQRARRPAGADRLQGCPRCPHRRRRRPGGPDLRRCRPRGPLCVLRPRGPLCLLRPRGALRLLRLLFPRAPLCLLHLRRRVRSLRGRTQEVSAPPIIHPPQHSSEPMAPLGAIGSRSEGRVLLYLR